MLMPMHAYTFSTFIGSKGYEYFSSIRTIAHTLSSTPFLFIHCEMTALFPFVLGFGMTNIPSQQGHLLLSNTFVQLISVDTNQFVKSRSVKSAKC